MKLKKILYEQKLYFKNVEPSVKRRIYFI